MQLSNNGNINVFLIYHHLRDIDSGIVHNFDVDL